MTLGDLGADVIKVESPLGDDTRRWKPPKDAQGRAAYHHTANRNKRSIVLDLKSEPDLELARRLCERADVVVSNFLPGTLQRFGLDYERIAAVNPGVVHCEISGFGEGAGAALPGYDPLVQALSGLMSVTGPAGTPSKTGVAVTDVVAALYATVAVLAALYARRDTGPRPARHDRPAAREPRAAREPVDGLPRERRRPACARQRASVDRAVRDLSRGGRRADDLRRQRRAVPAARRRARSRATTSASRRTSSASRTATRCARSSRRRSPRGRAPSGRTGSPPRAFRPGRCRRSTRRSRSRETLGLAVVDETDGVRTVAFPAHLSETPATVRRRPPDLDEHGGRDQARVIVTSTPAFLSRRRERAPGVGALEHLVRDVVLAADRDLRRDDLDGPALRPRP